MKQIPVDVSVLSDEMLDAVMRDCITEVLNRGTLINDVISAVLDCDHEVFENKEKES